MGPVIDGLFFNRLNGQVDYIIKDPVPASEGSPIRGLGQHPARLVQLPLDQRSTPVRRVPASGS